MEGGTVCIYVCIVLPWPESCPRSGSERGIVGILVEVSRRLGGKRGPSSMYVCMMRYGPTCSTRRRPAAEIVGTFWFREVAGLSTSTNFVSFFHEGKGEREEGAFQIFSETQTL